MDLHHPRHAIRAARLLDVGGTLRVPNNNRLGLALGAVAEDLRAVIDDPLDRCGSLGSLGPGLDAGNNVVVVRRLQGAAFDDVTFQPIVLDLMRNQVRPVILERLGNRNVEDGPQAAEDEDRDAKPEEDFSALAQLACLGQARRDPARAVGLHGHSLQVQDRSFRIGGFQRTHGCRLHRSTLLGNQEALIPCRGKVASAYLGR